MTAVTAGGRVLTFWFMITGVYKIQFKKKINLGIISWNSLENPIGKIGKIDIFLVETLESEYVESEIC